MSGIEFRRKKEDSEPPMIRSDLSGHSDSTIVKTTVEPVSPRDIVPKPRRIYFRATEDK